MIPISEKLNERLQTIPELPGIYKMMDAHGNIIYIGKSKCLKKRVKSYFANDPKWEKVNKLVMFIDDIEYEVTDTHLEARLLECQLIKKIKPFFNSQMKHDKNYVYLKIELMRHLEDRMMEASSCYKYETASKYRDMLEGMKYLANGIFRYNDMISKDIVLKIPTIAGYKLFYISKGHITYKEQYSSLTKRQINAFIKKSQKQKTDLTFDMNDKSSIDFRDIIYSEILTLPKDSIIEVY